MQFKDIFGQKETIHFLLERVKKGQIPHAQLFSGNPGSGKLAMTLAFVQYLLCENKSDNDSCGECKSCSKTSKLIHPDVHFSFPVISKKSGHKPTSNDFMETWRSEVVNNPHISYIDWMNAIGAENKQGNITKEECKSIIQKLSLKPFESSEKVLIMWLPEHLGKEGNTLLKLIEEPPAHTFFILITENSDAILPTILSRTQLVKINPYKPTDVVDHLRHLGIEGDLESIAFLANGNFSEALHLAEHTDNDLTEKFIIWMRHSFRRDVPKLMKWSDEMGTKGRENIKNFLTYCLSVLREITAYKMIPNYTVRLGKEEQEFVSNFSGVVQFANIEVLYKGINECIGQIERNANPKLTLFQLSLQVRDSFLETHKAQLF